MTRPVAIDLYCCEGGAGMGYHRAGFKVVGVDIEPQPRYPFTFHKGDALAMLPELIERYRPALVHASPTCQRKARVTAWRGNREDHPNTLTPTLRAFEQLDIPWVIENVPEAADELRPDYLLCGTQFGLRVRRHRIFQRGNWNAYELLPPCQCYRNPNLLAFEHKGERAFADAMGCHWMTNLGGRQAIPPAYTEHIGRQMLDAIRADQAVA